MKKTKAPAAPHLIEGASFFDDRGSVSFINSFSFEDVKRFYAVENLSTSVIRAFHGHEKEAKYAFVAAGTFIFAAVEMDDTRKPNKKNHMHRFILDERKPAVLYIPAGHANGFRALNEKNKIFFFSTSTLEESRGDDFRFPPDYWGGKVWEVENR